MYKFNETAQTQNNVLVGINLYFVHYLHTGVDLIADYNEI